MPKKLLVAEKDDKEPEAWKNPFHLVLDAVKGILYPAVKVVAPVVLS